MNGCACRHMPDLPGLPDRSKESTSSSGLLLLNFAECHLRSQPYTHTQGQELETRQKLCAALQLYSSNSGTELRCAYVLH